MTYNIFFVMGYVVLFFFYMGYLFWLRHGLSMYGFFDSFNEVMCYLVLF